MDSHTLLHLAHLYAAQRSWRISTVSSYMGGSGDTLARLERGHDITTRRVARFVQWFSDHWPADLEWPSDIPRPAPGLEHGRGEAADAVAARRGARRGDCFRSGPGIGDLGR